MGWKISCIVIKNSGNVSDETILNRLFVAKFKQLDDTDFDDCMFTYSDELIHFGNYSNCLIVATTAYGLVDKFFTSKISKAEDHFIQLFPQSEIGAFVLHSVTNYFGWCIIERGQKIRCKMGDADNGTTVDFGNPLPEEQDLLRQSVLDKKGRRIYRFEGYENDPSTEDQVGESFVDVVWSRFTGIGLFNDDELLEDIPFRKYVIESIPDPDYKPFWKLFFGRK